MQHVHNFGPKNKHVRPVPREWGEENVWATGVKKINVPNVPVYERISGVL